MGNFFRELKRRHVFRVGLAYLVVAWLVLQLVNNIVAPLHLPDWTATFVIVILAVGFPIALILAWAFEMTPEGVKRTEEADEAVPLRSTASIGHTLNIVIVMALALAVAYLGWRQFVAPTRTALQTTSATMPTLAVLPFANLSDDKSQDYFADGLSEELMDKLANLKGLQVAGRTSSFYFKGKNEDLRVIGEKLGVKNLLEGSVQKSGDELRITAQLIDAKTGYHVWSETYDRKLKDVFAIQDAISKSVATALSVALGVGELGRIEGGTRNVAAYDAYLRSRWREGVPASTALFRNRIQSLEQAVKLDPSYAVAWAAIASSSRTLALFDPANAQDWKKKADDALAHARDLAPNTEPVLAESAAAAVARSDWAEAERVFRKAIDLHGDAAVAPDYGEFLLKAGKAKKAIDYLLEAKKLDPLDAIVLLFVGTAYAETGKTKEALAELDSSIRAGHSSFAFSALAVAMGTADRQEIERHFAMAEKLAPDDPYFPTAKLRPLLGHPEDARAVLQRIYDDPKNNSPLGRDRMAVAAAYFGDTDLALSALNESASADNGFSNLFGIWVPVLSDTRKLPGFKDFVRKLRLVDYWRQYGWGDFCHPVGDNDFECD